MTFESPLEKQRYVNDMFARIAHRYDLMNRIMTGGQDGRWRRLLIEQAQLPPGGTLLDIATGTGDIAFEALYQHTSLRHVVGADFTLPMMRIGQQRWARKTAHLEPNHEPYDIHLLPPLKERLSWSAADTLHLPFPDNSFDAIVSGFLMRNVTSARQALMEQRRVSKVGGRVLILEIPRPPDNLFGTLFRFYFYKIVPLIGGVISGQRDAYAYLPASADAFLRPDELKSIMEGVGLRQVSYTMLMFNTVALHVGLK